MNKEITEIKNIIKKYYDKKYKESKYINGISGNTLYCIKKYNDKKEYKPIKKLLEYINNDYLDGYIKQFNNLEYEIVSELKKYINNKGLKIDKILYYTEYEEGYSMQIEIQPYCNFSISGLLKYYSISDKYYDNDKNKYIYSKDKELEKNLEQFFINRGYTKLTKELGEQVLDIDGEDLHSLKRHKELQLKYYKTYFGDDKYYFDGNDGREKANSKEEDLEKFLTYDYEGEYKVKNLLFG